MKNDELFEGLPFLVQPDNVARYEDGKVLILDRRDYPFKKEFVVCDSYSDVARAVLDMVTQSGGPFYATAWGMVQAAHRIKGAPTKKQIDVMEDAASVLGTARPTNNSILYLANAMLNVAKETLLKDGDIEAALFDYAKELVIKNYSDSSRLGEYAAHLIHDGDGILNHCWAETSIVYTMIHAKRQGKKIHAYCDETRPYLQGARLTADAISEIGVPTTVICDSMAGYAMRQGLIQCFFSGADRVTRSGHVINKVGTFQAALCAHFYGLPYYAFCHGPDPKAFTDEDVVIEERDPDESLYCLGHRTATANVTGYYPAFDVTPPELVSAIITQKGVYSPYNIEDYLNV